MTKSALALTLALAAAGCAANPPASSVSDPSANHVVQGALTEDQVIAEITALGGTVTKDPNSPGNPVIQITFRDVPGVTDAALRHLPALKHLQYLDLANTQVTDGGLTYIKQLSELTNLELQDTQVSDAGLPNLLALTKLKLLGLQRTKVTDAGEANLQKQMPNVTIDRRFE